MEQDRPVRDRYREEEQEGVGQDGDVKAGRPLDLAGSVFVPSAGRKPPIKGEHRALNKNVPSAELRWPEGDVRSAGAMAGITGRSV
jgi:hypothetical protein